jgi:hypothetical protein
MSKSKPMSGEIVIELDDGHNSRLEFPPLMDWFRGRWTPAGLVAQSASRGSAVCQLEMPGQCIALDVARRRGRVFDPLEEPENKPALEQFDSILRTKDALHRGSRACPEQVHEDLSEEQVASWWHWMRELAEIRKTAKLVAGQFSKQPEGDPRIDYYSMDPHVPRTLSEMNRWRAGKWRPGAEEDAA